jgi:hypothetical protein
MFKTEYIFELVSGNLSEKGYKSIIGSIAGMTRKFRWQKSIITSDSNNSDSWSADDVKELTHQFFEWVIDKGKLAYLNKIPENYLSYYFTQIFISFVANQISEEQKKRGLSFDKCKELVATIGKEKYFVKEIRGTEYMFVKPFEDNDIKSEFEIDNSIKYLSHYPIHKPTQHYKPLITMALEDIFNVVECPVSLPKLIKTVFDLFEQSSFPVMTDEKAYQMEVPLSDSQKYKSVIKTLLEKLDRTDARIISEYLFQSDGEVSLSTLSDKYKMPKSTLQHKTETFKKKIFENYIPENEDDGISFLRNLSSALDELAK